MKLNKAALLPRKERAIEDAFTGVPAAKTDVLSFLRK
ncbi:hypothetical protein HNQ57_002594 [Zhongshania antarctica]|uniref:Uncharacterized protein n=1 Tax=Zhongshania antarctica TaxID=641702 RepID=A0A840R553_9GAMM|nr:hypothetical protein [Zhongshania antarctica]